MDDKQLDAILDNVESLHRISSALTRDLDELRGVLKHVQAHPAGPNNADGLAFATRVLEMLPHYIPDAGMRASLAETLTKYYCDLHQVAMPIGAGVYDPAIIQDVHLVDESAGPTLATSMAGLLKVADTVAAVRRATVPATPGETMAQFMSPAILAVGRGFLRPGTADLGGYQEDITKIPAKRLQGWPTGFYSYNADSGVARQFMVRTDSFIFVVDGLDVNVLTPTIYQLSAGNAGEFIPLSELSRAENLVFSAELHKELSELSAKVQL